jgi:hypothetical protein
VHNSVSATEAGPAENEIAENQGTESRALI